MVKAVAHDQGPAGGRSRRPGTRRRRAWCERSARAPTPLRPFPVPSPVRSRTRSARRVPPPRPGPRRFPGATPAGRRQPAFAPSRLSGEARYRAGGRGPPTRHLIWLISCLAGNQTGRGIQDRLRAPFQVACPPGHPAIGCEAAMLMGWLTSTVQPWAQSTRSLEGPDETIPNHVHEVHAWLSEQRG